MKFKQVIDGSGQYGSITNISVKEVGQNWDLLNGLGNWTDKCYASLTGDYQQWILSRFNPSTTLYLEKTV